ncbi:transposable element Tcb1 transposase [Trichonephila clavipes]|nr:transposable element Tcb1 transposase [Trichonephila clavipes]
MGTPTARNVAPAGSEYAETVRSSHCRRHSGTTCAFVLGCHGAKFFVDDNTRPHHANILKECLQLEDINRMDWPIFSPNSNPVEHVGDILGRQAAAHQPPPTCLLELRRALLDEWCKIKIRSII